MNELFLIKEIYQVAKRKQASPTSHYDDPSWLRASQLQAFSLGTTHHYLFNRLISNVLCKLSLRIGLYHQRYCCRVAAFVGVVFCFVNFVRIKGRMNTNGGF